MSVTLTNTPPSYSFSGDQIRAKFTLLDVFEVPGTYAINKVLLSDIIQVGEIIKFSYASQVITMTSAEAPDVSGEQYPIRSSPTLVTNSTIAGFFRSNYVLQNDFIITSDAFGIIFTAKRKGLAYNIAVYNTTPGAIEIIKPNLSVRFILYCENADNDGFENIYESPLTVFFRESVTAEAIINDKLHNYIAAEIRNNLPDIPDVYPLFCKKSCRRYYFEYAESYGEVEKIKKLHKSELYTVLHGGLSSIGQSKYKLKNLLAPEVGFKKFLKQGGNIFSNRSNQLQFLYFFNTDSSFTATLNCRLRFTDGSKSVIILKEFEILEKRKYGFNVSYSNVFKSENYPNKILLAYEIWLSGSEESRITDNQIFLMDYRPLEFIRYFINWSSWGSLDSRMFYGRGSLEFDIVQSVAQKAVLNSNIIYGTSLVYDLRITSKFSITTGFIENRSQLLFNRDFFLSALKYRVLGSTLLPVSVTSKTIPELTDGNNLLAQKFEYEYLFDDQAYTEGDIQEPGLQYEDYQIIQSDTFLTDQEKSFLLTTQNEFITI